jgi:hypothetical protein
MRATALLIVAAVAACAGPVKPSSLGRSSSEPPAPSATPFSADGVTWEFISDPALSPGSIRAMAGSGVNLVAAGSAVWTSDDGRRWTRVEDVPSGPAITAVGYGPSGWVALADGGTAWFSANGRRWRVAQASFDALADGGPTYIADEDVCCEVTLRGVANTAGTYLAVGAVACRKCIGRAAIWRSADGQAWTRVPYQVAFERAPLSAVTVLPTGRVVAVGRGSALVSDDQGVTWDATPAFGAGDASVLALVGDELLAAGLPGDVYAGAYWRSSDGLTWEPLPVDVPFPEAIPLAIGSTRGAVIIAGRAREPEDSADWGFTAISADLKTWRPVPTSDGRQFLIWSLAEVGGQMVAAGNFTGDGGQPAGVWILR